MTTAINRHFGSTVDEFLHEEGVLDEFSAIAAKEVVVWQINEEMRARNLTKNKMAELMGTSRAQLDRLLDPKGGNVTLESLQRAARVLGRELRVELGAALAPMRSPVSRASNASKVDRWRESEKLRRTRNNLRGEPVTEKNREIYIERRDEGDYAVRRRGSERASDVLRTQREAIERARQLEPGSKPVVERVRDTDRGGRDKWRKA